MNGSNTREKQVAVFEDTMEQLRSNKTLAALTEQAKSGTRLYMEGFRSKNRPPAPHKERPVVNRPQPPRPPAPPSPALPRPPQLHRPKNNHPTPAAPEPQRPRSALKNPAINAEHSSASMPPTTCVDWPYDSINRLITLPQEPVNSSRAP